MIRHAFLFHHAVAAFSIAFFAFPAFAGKADPALFDALAQTEGDAWMEAETQILTAWEDTGSQALNMIQLRGESALDEGDYLSAIGHLTALVDHAPDHATGYQLRGMAYWLNGDYGPAAVDLARALELEPKHYLALTQLGTMLEELNDTPRAIKALSRSLEINPHQQDAIDAKARLEAIDTGTNI